MYELGLLVQAVNVMAAAQAAIQARSRRHRAAGSSGARLLVVNARPPVRLGTPLAAGPGCWFVAGGLWFVVEGPSRAGGLPQFPGDYL